MSITSGAEIVFFNDVIDYYKSFGLYVTSSQDNIRWYGPFPGQNTSLIVPISASPTQTSGSYTALEVIVKGIIKGTTDYYATSAISISAFGLSVENGLSAVGTKLGINYNTQNLKINSLGQLDTFQTVSPTEIPTYPTINLTNLSNGMVVIVSGGKLITSAINNNPTTFPNAVLNYIVKFGSTTELLDSIAFDDGVTFVVSGSTSALSNVFVGRNLNVSGFAYFSKDVDIGSGSTFSPTLNFNSVLNSTRDINFQHNEGFASFNIWTIRVNNARSFDLRARDFFGSYLDSPIFIDSPISAAMLLSRKTIINDGLNVSGAVASNSTVIFTNYGGTGTRFLGVDPTGLLTIVGNVSANVSGTLNYIPKFNSNISIINSNIIDDGTTITLGGTNVIISNFIGGTTRYVTVDSSGMLIATSAVGSISGAASGTIYKISKFITSASLGDSIMRETSSVIVIEGSVSANGNLKVTGDSTFNSLSGTTNRFAGFDSTGKLIIVGNVSADINGTIGTIPKFVTGISIGNSIMTDNGSTITILGNVSASGDVTVNSLSGTNVRLVIIDANGKLSIGVTSASVLTSLNLTTGRIPKASGVNTLSDSISIDNGSTITILGNVSATGLITNNSLSGANTRLAVINSNGDLGTNIALSSIISGSGTAGKISKFSNTNALTDSIIIDNGSIVTVNGGISATGNIDIISLSGSNGRFVTVDPSGRLQIGVTSASILNGSLTTGRLPRASNSNTLVDSISIDNGSTLTILGNVSATGNLTVNSLSGTNTRIATIDPNGILGTTLTISNFVSGSGTINKIPKWNNLNGLTDSSITDTGSSINVIGLLTTTSNLTVSGSTNTFGSGFGNALVQLNGTNSSIRSIVFQTSGFYRWDIRANTTSESTANQGSNFELNAYDVSGSLLDTPISITRSLGGSISIARPTNFSSNVTVNSLNGIVSAASGLLTTISVLPISVGGTNNNSYQGAQFLWYNGTQFVSSNFTSASFLSAASGTIGTIPKFTAVNSIGNSLLSESGSVITLNGSEIINTNLNVSGTSYFVNSINLGQQGISNGIINTNVSMYFNIDADNDETGKSFFWGHNSSLTSSTKLMSLSDTGSFSLTGDMSVSSNVIFASILNVSGATTLKTTLIVGNRVTINSEGLVLNRDVGSAYIDFQNGSGVDTWVLQRDNNDGALELYSNSLLGTSALFRIENAGNSSSYSVFDTANNRLGINVASVPGYNLQVVGGSVFYGSISATGNLTVNSLSGTTNRFVTVDPNGLLGSSLSISNFVSGSGTTGKIIKWASSNSLTDSLISESGTLITLNGSELINSSLNVSGITSISSFINIGGQGQGSNHVIINPYNDTSYTRLRISMPPGANFFSNIVPAIQIDSQDNDYAGKLLYITKGVGSVNSVNGYYLYIDNGSTSIFNIRGDKSATLSGSLNVDGNSRFNSNLLSIGSLSTSGYFQSTGQGYFWTTLYVDSSLTVNADILANSSIRSERTGIGITSTDGIILGNSTAATALIPNQYSPRIRWQGRGWKNSSISSSIAVDWISELRTVSGSSNPTTQLIFAYLVGGPNYTDLLSLDSSLGVRIVGNTTIDSLSGTGTRFVTVDPNGLLGSSLMTTFVSGSGTVGKISKWASPNSLTDSIMRESGNGIFVNGSFVLSGAGGNLIVIDGAPGTFRYFEMATSGSPRWLMLCNTTAETGSNNGSDFELRSYDDSGILIDYPILITRKSSGLMTVGRPILAQSNLNISGTATINSAVVLYSTLQLINGLFSGRKGLFDNDFTLGSSPLVAGGAMVYNAGTGVLTFSPTSYTITSTLNVSGSVELKTLAGTLNRFVTVDANGLLGSSLSMNSFVSGSGTVGKISKWNTLNGLTDSLISESGSIVTLNGSQVINTNLNVSGTSTIKGIATFYTNITKDAGAAENDFFWDEAGTNRWNIRVDASNRNFNIRAFDNSGVLIDTPLIINRATGGSFQVARNGYFTQTVSIGIAPVGNHGLLIGQTLLTTNSQYGIYCNPTFNTSATTQGTAIWGRVTVANGASLPSGFGLYIPDPVKNGTGILQTNYAIYLEDQTRGNSNFSIYTGTGKIKFGDSISATTKLTIHGVGSYLDIIQEYFVLEHSNSFVTLRSEKNGGGTYRPIRFQTNGSTALTIDTSQNAALVGRLNINGATDNANFSVNAKNGYIASTGSSFGVLSYGVNAPGDANNEYILLRHNGSLGQLFVSQNGTGLYRDFVLYTNNNERFRVTSAGNVNIGADNNTSYGLLDVRSSSSNSVIASFGNTTSVNSIYPAYIYFSNTNTINFGYNVNANAEGYINYVGYQAGSTQYRDLRICDGKTNTLAFFDGSTGNVGLGFINPGILYGNTITDKSFHVSAVNAANVVIQADVYSRILLAANSGSAGKRIFAIHNDGLTKSTTFLALADDTSTNKSYTQYFHASGEVWHIQPNWFESNIVIAGSVSSGASKLQVNGSYAGKITRTSSNLTLDSTHHTIICTNTVGNITINLPAISTCDGREYRICIGDAYNAGMVVDIQPFGTETVNADAGYWSPWEPGPTLFQSSMTGFILIADNAGAYGPCWRVVGG